MHPPIREFSLIISTDNDPHYALRTGESALIQLCRDHAFQLTYADGKHEGWYAFSADQRFLTLYFEHQPWWYIEFRPDFTFVGEKFGYWIEGTYSCSNGSL